jgi:hypothetical protein
MLLKKFFIFTIIASIGLFFSACDTTEDLVNGNSTGQVNVTSTPDGAQIYVNDVYWGKTTPATITIELDPGNTQQDFTIRLELTGYQSSSATVTVYENQTVTHAVTMIETSQSLTVESNPAGAEIFLNGVTTGKVTPADVTLQSGDNALQLKRDGYLDTLLTVNSATTSPLTVDLSRAYIVYGPIRIYETQGTTTSQPSGIDLSEGLAYGVGSSSANRDKVDIYYSTSLGFVVTAAGNYSGLSKNTYFYIGSNTDIADGVNSPERNASWTDRVQDTQANYFFLYDSDGYYTKMRITGRGGGTGAGDPAYVDVTWFYSKVADLREF